MHPSLLAELRAAARASRATMAAIDNVLAIDAALKAAEAAPVTGDAIVPAGAPPALILSRGGNAAPHDRPRPIPRLRVVRGEGR